MKYMDKDKINFKTNIYSRNKLHRKKLYIDDCFYYYDNDIQGVVAYDLNTDQMAIVDMED